MLSCFHGQGMGFNCVCWMLCAKSSCRISEFNGCFSSQSRQQYIQQHFASGWSVVSCSEGVGKGVRIGRRKGAYGQNHHVCILESLQDRGNYAESYNVQVSSSWIYPCSESSLIFPTLVNLPSWQLMKFFCQVLFNKSKKWGVCVCACEARRLSTAFSLPSLNVSIDHGLVFLDLGKKGRNMLVLYNVEIYWVCIFICKCQLIDHIYLQFNYMFNIT